MNEVPSQEPAELSAADKKAQASLKARIYYHAGLMKSGKIEEATQYAIKHALPAAMLETAPSLPPAGTPSTEAAPPKPSKVASPASWPESTTGVIIGLCPNPRLCILQLPDGRTSSVWRSGYAVRAKVRVVLDKRLGDPIYRVTGAI